VKAHPTLYYIFAALGLTIVVLLSGLVDADRKERVDTLSGGPYVVELGHRFADESGWTADLDFAKRFPDSASALRKSEHVGGRVVSVREVRR
jgi:hypothetical protein